MLVERLLEAGVQVPALHPNQVKAPRERFRASGRKSGRFDRFVLCELARTDRHRFRVLEPDYDQTKALRTVGRAWCRVVWRCWQTHNPYHPQRHTGVTQTAAQRAERAALDSTPSTATHARS